LKIRVSFDSILIVLLYFIFGVILFTKIYITFSHSSDLAGIEEATYYNIHKLFIFGRLYCASPNDFPYTITPHTPFYYYFISWVSKLFFSGSQTEIYEQYVFGRLISLFFVCSGMILIYKALRKLCVHKLLSLVLVFFAFTSLDNHVFSMRPDGLKLFFSCLYFFFVVQYILTPHRNHLVLLACIVSVGFFVKQDEILISAVGSIVLLYNKRIKEFIVYNAFIILMLFIINFLLYKFEPYYVENIFFAVAELKGFTHFLEILHVYFIYKYYYIIILILLIVFLNRTDNKKMIPLFLSSIVLFVFSLIISNKWGSSTTYYTDFQIAAILCLGVIITSWKNEMTKFIFVSFLCISSIRGFYLFNIQYIDEMKINKINFQKKQKLANYIKLNFKTQKGEYYYCLDPSFNIFLPDNQLLGAIHTNDIWVYAKFKYKMEGKVKTPFSDKQFLKDLNSPKVPYVIINNDDYIIEKFSKLHTCRHKIVFKNNDFIIYKNL
jgi:hypothetical protein